MISEGQEIAHNTVEGGVAPRVTSRLPRLGTEIPWRLIDLALTPLLLSKAKKIKALCADYCEGRVLDVGAGRCYIAARLEADLKLQVTCLDIKNLSRNHMKVIVYGGTAMPFETDEYDSAVIAYVLHHCDDPLRVLREAVRVCKGNLVIFEDTKPSRVTNTMDILANHITGVETPCYFRSEEEWRSIFSKLNLKIVTVKYGVEKEWFYPFVEHTMFVVRK